jgi:hypothetical protein
MESKFPPRVWLRFGSNWCEGHLQQTPGEIPYVPESSLAQAVSAARAEAEYQLVKRVLDHAETLADMYTFEAAVATGFVELMGPIVSAKEASHAQASPSKQDEAGKGGPISRMAR